MNAINKDGIFQSESSAFEGWLEKLYFVGNTFMKGNKVHWIIDGGGNRTCYIDDIRADKNGYEKAKTWYNMIPKIEWHDYTEEAIRKSIMEYQCPIGSEAASERQQYLDSLAYLVGMTYDTAHKTPEELYVDGKNYYEGCCYEMDKIYQLYTFPQCGDADGILLNHYFTYTVFILLTQMVLQKTVHIPKK